jgi:hypothetical protein
MYNKINRRIDIMDKPVSMRISETKDLIIEVINSSELPASILAEIVSGVALQVNNLAKSELENDKKKYLESQKSEDKNVVPIKEA